MIYENLHFPRRDSRPYFYSNFVTTIDGKAQVITARRAYWPIGSPLDYEVLLELRAYADLLIHGKQTALEFRTIDTLAKESFKNMRRELGKGPELPYMVISSNPDDALVRSFVGQREQKALLVTTNEAVVSEELAQSVRLIRCGTGKVDLVALAALLQQEGYKDVLVEGGPLLMGSFLEHDLIDEIFLTLAPKIFGARNGETITMVEGVLFAPDTVKRCRLLSVKQIGDELFLRYAVQG